MDPRREVFDRLVKTLSIQASASHVFNDDIRVTVGRSVARRGWPVTMRIFGRVETRWLGDKPTASELIEMMDFLTGYVVTREVHES